MTARVHSDQPNRLIHSSSPYLILHAHNPVDWYPWGEEAIARARRESKPIFISVGYSTCFWCHVMERESFASQEIAALMNEWFVNIKIDREERPDLDEIYMTATQLSTGRGGWPNSLFLTPDLKPFFAGTYFPPEDRDGMPGFPRLLEAIHQAWSGHKDEVIKTADELTSRMHAVLSRSTRPGTRLPAVSAAETAVLAVQAAYDSRFGGFAEAPKFPSVPSLWLLWDRAKSGDDEARNMVSHTLKAMGRGAIYDQLGGGFHRYTLDAAWRIPHFEKMLYDNAQIGELLADVIDDTHDEELTPVARRAMDFVLRKMTLPGGGFATALDAESDGEEGAYYTWSKGELLTCLGEEGFELVGSILGIDGSPNLPNGRFTLYLTASLSEHARRLDMSESELRERLNPYLQKLHAARHQRIQPALDDKVLTDTNGMMIAALARAAKVFHEPSYLDAAEKAARFILAHLKGSNGVLHHAWRLGHVSVPALLDDYVFFIRGLLTLHQVTGAPEWLLHSIRLAEEMEGRLAVAGGGYYQSAQDEYLLFQATTAHDGAIPSGNGVAALDLLTLALMTGDEKFRQRAELVLASFATHLENWPYGSATLALARLRLEQGWYSKGPSTSRAKVAITLTKLDDPLPDGWRPFAIRVVVPPGWHVNAEPGNGKHLTATKLLGEVRNVIYPKATWLTLSPNEHALAVYAGTVIIRGEVAPNEEYLEVRYQACDDRSCLPPVDERLPIASSSLAVNV